MEAEKIIKVGISYRNYVFERTTYGNNPEGVEYIRGWDIPIHYITDRFPFMNIHFFFGPPNIDLFHTLNGIVGNRRPWITSFEAEIPWFGSEPKGGRLYRWGVKKLKSKYCKAIIAVCERAKRLLENETWFDQTIADKTAILYYAVNKIEIARIVKPKDEVRIIFIGHDFFRKGGHLLFEAFKQIENRYPNLRMTVVSRLGHGDYMTHATAEMSVRYRALLESHPKIDYYRSVENKILLDEIMPLADIFAFPTLDETFGISIIEAMSVGLPVISTAVNAIPEMIESGVEGELIKLPTDKWGSIGKTSPQIEEHITRELIRILSDFIENPAKRKAAGKAAQLKWERKFSSERRAKQLTALYRAVMRGAQIGKISEF